MKKWRVTLYKNHDIICVEDTEAENRYEAKNNVGWGKDYDHSNVEERVEGMTCTHCNRPIETLAYGSLKVCGTCLSAD